MYNCLYKCSLVFSKVLKNNYILYLYKLIKEVNIMNKIPADVILKIIEYIMLTACDVVKVCKNEKDEKTKKEK